MAYAAGQIGGYSFIEFSGVLTPFGEQGEMIRRRAVDGIAWKKLGKYHTRPDVIRTRAGATSDANMTAMIDNWRALMGTLVTSAIQALTAASHTTTFWSAPSFPDGPGPLPVIRTDSNGLWRPRGTSTSRS